MGVWISLQSAKPEKKGDFSAFFGTTASFRAFLLAGMGR